MVVAERISVRHFRVQEALVSRCTCMYVLIIVATTLLVAGATRCLHRHQALAEFQRGGPEPCITGKPTHLGLIPRLEFNSELIDR